MTASELVQFFLLPIGLGLLGFVEPCSIGSSLLFIKYLEGKAAAIKLVQVAIFTLTRAVFIGALGAAAALAGTAFIGFQKSGWVALGLLYLAIGVAYATGRAGLLMRSLGPSLARLSGARGTVGLGILFGLNIPACAAPLLVAILGTAVVGGTAGIAAIGKGAASLGLFGLALSAPLALAVVWPPTSRVLDRLSAASARLPVWIGLLFAGLGAWSIYFGFFVSPVG
ncbi:MAG: hypothetical protein ACT4P2_10310 [Pseudomonadota bacterium]